jgi:hypothetical protein
MRLCISVSRYDALMASFLFQVGTSSWTAITISLHPAEEVMARGISRQSL